MLYSSICLGLLSLLLTADRTSAAAFPPGTPSDPSDSTHHNAVSLPEGDYRLKLITLDGDKNSEFWAAAEKYDEDPELLFYSVVAESDMTKATKVSYKDTQLIFHSQWGDQYLNWENITATAGVYYGILTDESGISGIQSTPEGWLKWTGALSDPEGWSVCPWMDDAPWNILYIDRDPPVSEKPCKRARVLAVPWEDDQPDEKS
ncbi:hypothetical protein ACJ72_03734 [Emergomyces africanus]|uniref:Uncharacterized protein n=1 Tax=Emergomyces africanus TaxID=1955775 RepID=A0A1B7NYQ3_9EURO|nr:hypothetical protein ACJ72_03734 [Emergomyces africanus]